MLHVLGELTAFALIVAFSPFSVIPAIALVLHSERPRATGLAFVAGWLAGKAAITVLFIGVPRLLHQIDRSPDAATSAWIRIVLGALCIGAGIWQYTRGSGDVGLQSPGWLTRIKRITPGWAAIVGVGLTMVNPKVVVACAAAGYAIGNADLGAPLAAAAVVYFTAVAGSTAAVPVLAYALAAQRIDPLLDRIKAWLQQRGSMLLVIVLLVLGAGLLLSGIGALR